MSFINICSHSGYFKRTKIESKKVLGSYGN